MEAINELKRYVGFTEADAERLRALLPWVEPELQGMVDRFYAAILSEETTRAVLRDEAQVGRLKGTLKQWIRELLSGPHDLEYWGRRKRIGRAHVRVGLPNRYIFSAMSLLRQDLLAIAFRSAEGRELLDLCESIGRITDLELAAMSGSYLEAHEERELRGLQDLIVRNLPVTILCLDDRGAVTAATRPGASLFQGGVGQHIADFLPAEFIEASNLRARILRALESGEPEYAPRVLVGSGLGQRRFRLGVVPLRHPLVRVLVHVEDMTDVTRTEIRLQQAEALARIGALSANMAHEIRNPLTAISTTLQVISGSLDGDDPRRGVLAMVETQIQRLNRLVSDLLAYARPAQVRMQSVDLEALAREGAAISGVAAELDVVDASRAMADPQMVQQILINLLINARDAGGAVRLRVGPGARLVVSDDGPGIDPEVAETLFEPFVTTKSKGTGLGLAISLKLAESMGGALYLESEPGRGAAFTLELLGDDQSSS